MFILVSIFHSKRILISWKTKETVIPEGEVVQLRDVAGKTEITGSNWCHWLYIELVQCDLCHDNFHLETGRSTRSALAHRDSGTCWLSETEYAGHRTGYYYQGTKRTANFPAWVIREGMQVEFIGYRLDNSEPLSGPEQLADIIPLVQWPVKGIRCIWRWKSSSVRLSLMYLVR